MTSIPLRMGALGPAGVTIHHSGVRWLCEEGQVCRPGEIIGFCNVRIVDQRGADVFPEEARDFQIAFATRLGGQLHKATNSSRGGFLDLLPQTQLWKPDFVIGHLDCPSGKQTTGNGSEDELRLLFLAGRRMTELAEIRSGLLTGWHDRSRAWWGDDGDFCTVLGLGFCEQAGIIRGERFAFLELFESTTGPAHLVYTFNEPLVPCALIAKEQFLRTTAQFEAIATDIAKSFPALSAIPTPADWMFVGSLLSALKRSPLTERCDVLTRKSLRRTGPASAVILSLGAESPVVMRHRRLGYSVNIHQFRIAQAGPAVREWIRTHFEPVRRSPDDVAREYRAFVDAVRAKTDMKFLVINAMSSSGSEQIYSYASFDLPMRDTLAYIRIKELNLMLHDLARQRDVSIVDQDAIAAELGAAEHLRDGVHASGIMQAEVRNEILRILRARAVAGFGPTRSSDLELNDPRA